MKQACTWLGWPVGDAPALIAFSESGAERWTYQRLNAAVEQLARGLEPGRCALLAWPSPAYVVAVLAILRAGGTVVPIDAQIADDGLVHILEETTPRYLFTDGRGAQRLTKLRLRATPAVVRLDDAAVDGLHWATLSGDRALADQPAAEAVIFYTSGTTGLPKGVPLTPANLTYQFEVAAESGIIRAGDTLLLPLPLHHVYPFVIGLLTVLHLGLTVVFPAALTGPQLMRAIREGEVSVILGVPRLYRALIDGIRRQIEQRGWLARQVMGRAWALSDWARRRWGRRWGLVLLKPLHRKMGGRLRVLASGGSQLDAEIAAQIRALGWDVAVGYGLTETSPLLTILRPDDDRLASVGRAVPGTTLKLGPLSEPSGDAVDRGDGAAHGDGVGEVWARGPGVFGGYLEASAGEDVFVDGWYRTGDVGRVDADGYLYLQGRAATMLVLEGGENVAPEALEQRYEEGCEALREIGVLQVDGKLVAVIVPRDGLEGEAAATAVREGLEAVYAALPSYQRLAGYRLDRQDLPRTRLGKIRRQALAARYAALAAGETRRQAMALAEMESADQVLLDQPAARSLWDLLVERYGHRGVAPDSRLGGELGIDSMEWVELSLAIEERLKLVVGDAVAEQARTVRDLLELAVRETAGKGRRLDPQQAIRRPDQFLNAEEQRWLRPRSRLTVAVETPIYLAHGLIWRTAFSLKVSGLEHLPTGQPHVLAPNHVSYLDAPAVIAALGLSRVKPYYWAGLTELLFETDGWNIVNRLGQVIPVDSTRGPIVSLAYGAAVLQRGAPLVWFPEGGRSPDGTLQPFRLGLGLILREIAVPVVPVYISGTEQAMPVGGKLRRAPVQVTFGPPRMPAELIAAGEGATPEEQMMQGLRQSIEAMAPASVTP
jgi:long-chain acyl-CoA synthetase